MIMPFFEDDSFNLLALHDSEYDAHAKSWISAQGALLYDQILTILTALKPLSKKRIARIISERLGVSIDPVKGVVYNTRNWHPIPVILELLSLWTQHKNPSPSEFLQIQQRIVISIERLKTNCSLSRSVKAPKRLSESLAKICGAHAADGWMGRRYHEGLGYSYEYTIREEHAFPLLKFGEWLRDVFDISTRVVKDRSGLNCHNIDLNNKVIVRFLHTFLNFPYGKKTETVDEPEVVKRSQLRYRKAFALGVLTFDGYMGKRVELLVKSKRLRDAVWNIARADNLQVRAVEHCDKYGRWLLYSPERLDGSLNRWVDYFEPGTKKYLRLISRINSKK